MQWKKNYNQSPEVNVGRRRMLTIAGDTHGARGSSEELPGSCGGGWEGGLYPVGCWNGKGREDIVEG